MSFKLHFGGVLWGYFSGTLGALFFVFFISVTAASRPLTGSLARGIYFMGFGVINCSSNPFGISSALEERAPSALEKWFSSSSRLRTRFSSSGGWLAGWRAGWLAGELPGQLASWAG